VEAGRLIAVVVYNAAGGRGEYAVKVAAAVWAAFLKLFEFAAVKKHFDDFAASRAFKFV
jgi:hypothetical protein